MTKRGLSGLLLAASIPPWALAVVVTTGWTWATSGGDAAETWLGDLLLTAMLAHPAVVIVGAAAVITVLHRAGRTQAELWWMAGGLFALVAFAAAVIEGLVLGGEFGAAWAALWALLSGHVVFTFGCGAYAWSRVITRVAA